MRIHHYDPETRYYLGSSLADADPVVDQAITEREKRITEADANERARQDAEQRGDVLILPYPNAEDPNEIPVMEPSFLLPAHCTAVAPPDWKEGQIAIWIDDAWAIVDLPKPSIPTEDGEEVEADFVPDDNWSPNRTEAEYMAWAEKVLQAHLDLIARSAGYRNIDRMISYADEPAVPKYQAQGKAARRWRSLFWDAAYKKLDRISTLRSLPKTAADLVEELPEYEPPELT